MQQWYRGIVFKRATPALEFGQTEAIALPGVHTKEDAWRAVMAALQGADGGELIGGEVRPDAEMHVESDAEMRS